MRLELTGELKRVYDWLVEFHNLYGRGATCREMGVGGIASSGTATIYTRVLEDLGLVNRNDVKKPSGYLALEISPTDTNPYDEVPA